MLTRPAANPDVGKTQAVELIRQAFESALAKAPQARALAQRLVDTCSVRLWDLVDSIGLQNVSTLPSLGWRKRAPGIWSHTRNALPDIVERDRLSIALRVENLAHLLKTMGLETPIEGQEFGPFRRARIIDAGDVTFDAVERNGSDAHEAVYLPERRIRRALIHQQLFRTRRREFRSADKGLNETRRLVAAAVADLGPSWACELFLRAEREFWMRWCAAGLLQFKRQARAGIGWCNVDHYTYIASREHAHDVMEILHELGFQLDETLRVDGWASQVLRHPVVRTTATVDLDLGPDETLVGGAHPLPPLLWHGCAGMWVDLHGEGLLESGPHHIACLLDRSAFARRAKSDDIALMQPSSDRREFFRQMTHAEARAIGPRRIDRLEHHELLTTRQAEHFRLHGGLAAHFECIERNDGFSGLDTPAAAPVALS